MKLSEYYYNIEFEQSFGAYLAVNINTDQWSCCSLGALYLENNQEDKKAFLEGDIDSLKLCQSKILTDLNRKFPILLSEIYQTDLEKIKDLIKPHLFEALNSLFGKYNSSSLAHFIMQMNDRLKLTFKKIAFILDKLGY